MGPNDIGFISDIDEIVTRDFLRALQTCEVPQFQGNHQKCWEPKICASTVVFEGSLTCLTEDRRWHHPDFVIGECLDKIGDPQLHPPVERIEDRYTYAVDFDKAKDLSRPGPLWASQEIRRGPCQMRDGKIGDSSIRTGYHLHNFFDHVATLRNKYVTYGHPRSKFADSPLRSLEPADIHIMLNCLTDGKNSAYFHENVKLKLRRKHEAGGYKSLPPYFHPIAVQVATGYTDLRHEELKKEIELDEQRYGK
jgi:hypothetical protein